MFGFLKKRKIDSILDRAEEELFEIKNYCKIDIDDDQFEKHIDSLVATMEKISMISDLTFEQASRAKALINDTKRYLESVNTAFEAELVKTALNAFSEK